MSAKSKIAKESGAPGLRRHIIKPDTYVRITFKVFLNLKRQSLHAPTHVRVASRNPDAAARRKRDHDCSAFNVAAINAAEACAKMRTCAVFTAISIAAASLAAELGGAAVGASTMTAAKPQPRANRSSRRQR